MYNNDYDGSDNNMMMIAKQLLEGLEHPNLWVMNGFSREKQLSENP